MKTYMPKAAEIERKWYVIDAENVALGRLASKVADILTGKDRTLYTPHVDCGEYVIVINSDKVALTGNKAIDKKLRWHTGYIGGLKEVQYKTLLENDSPKAIKVAVKGMLPKNALGRKQITRLHIYKGSEHEQAAQKPVKVEIKGVRE